MKRFKPRYIDFIIQLKIYRYTRKNTINKKNVIDYIQKFLRIIKSFK